MKTFGKTTKKTEVTGNMGAQAMNKNEMEEYAEKRLKKSMKNLRKKSLANQHWISLKEL